MDGFDVIDEPFSVYKKLYINVRGLFSSTAWSPKDVVFWFLNIDSWSFDYACYVSEDKNWSGYYANETYGFARLLLYGNKKIRAFEA